MEGEVESIRFLEREGGQGGGEREAVTEIVTLRLRAGVEFKDLVGEDHQVDGERGEEGVFQRIWHETLQTVVKQKGCTNSYYGPVQEEEGVLIWCIGLFSLFLHKTPILTHKQDWTSLAQHKIFMDSPAYTTFLEKLEPIVESVQIIHVGWLNVERAVGNGVMEIITFFGVEDTFIEGTKKFITAMRKIEAQKGIVGFGGVIEYREVIEKIAMQNEGGEVKEEAKGRAMVLVVGWESKEVHMAFRETQDFLDNIGVLRKETSGQKMYHIAFKSAWI
ncbi:hypothetical protein DSL72_003724 [Monilinia vaccinii-corymbosi]|uniref:Uncharacterized protein n=1 Tax=Monilinia vaccinii-corymbosi TaxID=61207 RepID=A0A8A3NUS8_9HELO|nr:hypothetical protein DSL72_003724 [Monilinia vaccinii-corymbosi]